jgi:predicted nuclease of predicted toxin-antitoxin system
VRLLFDENLSDRLVERLADVFPGSRHVKFEGLLEADDLEVWDHARREGFVVVTKDKDFQQLSVLRGPPPQVVWLRVGNGSTDLVADQLRRHAAVVREFAREGTKSTLILACQQ